MPRFGQTINVRRLIERLRIECTDVHLTEIVGKDEDDIGLRLSEERTAES